MKNCLLVFGLLVVSSLAAQNKTYKVFYGHEMNRCDSSIASYYRIITLDAAGKPVGTTRDYYLTGELYGEGTISLLDREDADNDHKEGKWTNYYKSRKKQREGIFAKGVLNGTYRTWYENGKPQSEGNFANGKEQGLHKEWRENGNLVSETTFKDGYYDGPRRLYHGNGAIAYKENYKGKKLNGYAAAFHSNGILHWERNYVNGIMTDKCVPVFDADENMYTACNELLGLASKGKWKKITDRMEYASDQSSFAVVQNGLVVTPAEYETTVLYLNLTEPASSIYAIDFSFKSQTDDVYPRHPGTALVWNVKDSANYFFFHIYDEKGTFSVGRQSGGIVSYFHNAQDEPLPVGPHMDRSGTRKLMVARNGKDLDCYIDNIKVFTVPGQTFTNTAVGFTASGETLHLTGFIYAAKK